MSRAILIIFSAFTGSRKKMIPTKVTRNVPTPAQTAYAKLRSKALSAKVSAVIEDIYNTNTNMDGTSFVKPSESFIDIVPPTSKNIASNK